MVGLILALAASAQDEPDPVPADYTEITVWGEHQVRQARLEVVAGLEEIGWKATGKARDGVIVLKPPHAWMGRMKLFPDGRVAFLRPVVAFRWAQKNPQTREQAAPAFYLLPSRSRLDRMEQRTLEQVKPLMDRHQAILIETVFQENLAALPDKLDALWVDGAPLDGSETPIAGPEARKAHVLSYWAGRAATREGDAFSRAVEIWLRETVQSSATPVTEEERANAVSRRRDGRPLEL